MYIIDWLCFFQSITESLAAIRFFFQCILSYLYPILPKPKCRPHLPQIRQGAIPAFSCRRLFSQNILAKLFCELLPSGSLCTTKSELFSNKIPMWNESSRHCLASLGNTKEKCSLLL